MPMNWYVIDLTPVCPKFLISWAPRKLIAIPKSCRPLCEPENNI